MTDIRSWSRVTIIMVLAVACALLITPGTSHAQESRQSRSDITIRSAADFNPANGVRSGSGTAEDPFVISGWEVSNLYIKDTDASVLITNNTVRSRMTLDWIGRDVTVTDNEISDLRVNQNVRRTGLPTSGVISHNTFDTVGQLRHWDGEFAHNTVGRPFGTTPVDDALNEVFSSGRAVNFDGFNGAHFHDNVIYGYVDARIHGHHHSSDFGHDSHDHSDGAMEEMDHTQRYHEVWIHNNIITVEPGTFYALNYLDTNHAANDRTATSEENPALNDPHVHYTQVHITDNQLNGAGIRVNVFNANDERHLATSTGLLEIDRNTISLSSTKLLGFSSGDGIAVENAQDLDLRIRDNAVTGYIVERPLGGNYPATRAGVYLYTLDMATARIYDNTVSDLEYGIRGARFTDAVRWIIGGLETTGVNNPVYWDSSVPNRPEPRPEEEGSDGEEEHEEGGHDHHAP